MEYYSSADPERVQEVRTPPLKNHVAKGFISNTGPDPLEKFTKQPNKHSVLVRHRPASKIPFKLLFAGGQMMTRF